MHQQQTVLPGAEPKPSVAGLEHTEGIVAAIEPQLLRFKPVVETIQPLHHWLSPVCHGPDLIVAVNIHLRNESIYFLEIIVPDLRVGHQAPDALFHRRHPETALLVLRQIRHGRVDIHRQTFKRLTIKAKQEHALLSTDIQAFVAGHQCRYILVDAQPCDTVRLYLPAVVTAETVVGAKPDKAIFVLYDVTHGISRQPIIHRDVPITVVISCIQQQDGQQTGYK